MCCVFMISSGHGACVFTTNKKIPSSDKELLACYAYLTLQTSNVPCPMPEKGGDMEYVQRREQEAEVRWESAAEAQQAISMSILAQTCFGTSQTPLNTMLTMLVLRRLPDTSVICAVCGFPCDCWAGSIYGEGGEENQCNACCDIEIWLADPIYLDALTADNDDPSGNVGATAAYMRGKAIGKGKGKGMQGKAIGKPMKGKGKGHASASQAQLHRCQGCEFCEPLSPLEALSASLLPLLRTTAGVLLATASEATIEQATSAYIDDLAAADLDPSDVLQGPDLAAFKVRHGMACAAYNAMTVYWQGYKAKGKGKGKDGKVQKGQIPRTPTAGDGQLILGKDGKVSLNAIDIDEGNAKGKGMKGDKETMAYYKGKKGNDPGLYDDMTMAFEEAKALEQGKRTHRSRSPRLHH